MSRSVRGPVSPGIRSSLAENDSPIKIDDDDSYKVIERKKMLREEARNVNGKGGVWLITDFPSRENSRVSFGICS